MNDELICPDGCPTCPCGSGDPSCLCLNDHADPPTLNGGESIFHA